MSGMADDEIGREALALANEIQAVCVGRPTASVYIALSMILGASAAKAARPDFESMMALVDRAAFEEFRRSLSEDKT